MKITLKNAVYSQTAKKWLFFLTKKDCRSCDAEKACSLEKVWILKFKKWVFLDIECQKIQSRGGHFKIAEEADFLKKTRF